jgi:hypothetical protein
VFHAILNTQQAYNQYINENYMSVQSSERERLGDNIPLPARNCGALFCNKTIAKNSIDCRNCYIAC